MRRALGVMLIIAALTALLSGCAGEGNPAIAKVGDTLIYKSELESRSTASDKMFDSLTGYTEAEIDEKKRQAREAILEDLIMDRILLQKAAEQGITETVQMRQEAERGWERTVAAMTKYVLDSYPTLEGRELDETVEAMLKAQGLDRDTAIENSINNAVKAALLESVAQNAATPNEAELRHEYNALLGEQKSRFTLKPEDYEAQLLGGGIVVFVPEDCRVVQSVYFKFDEDIIALLKQLDSVGDTKTQEEMCEDQYRLLDEKIADAIALLDEGKAFSAIVQQWQVTSGTNYLTENTTRFSQETHGAIWNLEAQNMWTQPIKAEYGYYIYYWSDTLEAGEILFEDVYEELVESIMSTRRTAAIEDAKTLWRSEATVVIYLEKSA